MTADVPSKAILWVLLGGVVGLALLNLQRFRDLASKLGDDWSKLHPEVKVRALRVLDEANAHPQVVARGLKLGVHDGWRESSEQDKVLNAGQSQVSHPLNSYHRWGLAVDLVWIDKLGRWTWLERADKQLDPLWLVLGDIIKRHGFTWGADWDGDGNLAEHTLIDAPHAQLAVLPVAELRRRYSDDPERFVATFPELTGLEGLV